MGTIAEKLSYLKNTKDSIAAAIEGKGVQVDSTDTFRSYAGKIDQIDTGGGSDANIGLITFPLNILAIQWDLMNDITPKEVGLYIITDFTLDPVN